MKPAKQKQDRNWLKKAIRRPGRVQKYVIEKIGPDGFTSRGTIKPGALVEAKSIARKHHDTGMVDAIDLSQRMRKFKHKKRVKK